MLIPKEKRWLTYRKDLENLEGSVNINPIKVEMTGKMLYEMLLSVVIMSV